MVFFIEFKFLLFISGRLNCYWLTDVVIFYGNLQTFYYNYMVYFNLII